MWEIGTLNLESVSLQLLPLRQFFLSGFSPAPALSPLLCRKRAGSRHDVRTLRGVCRPKFAPLPFSAGHFSPTDPHLGPDGTVAQSAGKQGLSYRGTHVGSEPLRLSDRQGSRNGHRTVPRTSHAHSYSSAAAARGRPKTIVSDNGTGLTSNAILAWTANASVGWRYIAPVNPVQSAFIQSFDSSLRAEFLDETLVHLQARRALEDRCHDSKTVRLRPPSAG
jgi:transposase InsO family protein